MAEGGWDGTLKAKPATRRICICGGSGMHDGRGRD